MVKKILISTLIAILILVVTVIVLVSWIPRARADNRTITQEQVIQKGVSWLLNRQSGSGGWEPYSLVSGNALAIRAYASMGNRSSSEFGLLFDRLKKLQSPDGSWDKNILNTAYAVWALIEAGESGNSPLIQNAVSWLKAQSNFAETNTRNTKIVSLTIIALLKAGESKTSPLIADGVNWLKDNQNSDGFWGTFAGEPSVTWVKEAVIALILAESVSSQNVQKAIEYLRTHYSEYHGYDLIEGLEVFTCAGNTELIAIGQTKVLSEQNNNDYGWGKFPGWPSINTETAKAVFALAQSGYSGEPVNNAMQWIKGRISEAGDYEGDYVVVAPTAWAVLGLSMVQYVSSSIIDQATGLLTASQNGGWGWWSIYHPEVIGSETDNTGLCAWALHKSGKDASSDELQQAAAALIYGQNTDGGWGATWMPKAKSTVSSTNFALIALLCAGYGESNSNLKRGVDCLVKNSEDSHWESIGQTAMSSIILKKTSYDDQLLNKAVEWLVQNQNDDGGWGFNKGETSNIASTAITMVALDECERGVTSLARGAAWLMATQNADGGWNALAGTPSSNTAGTAQAIWALSLAEHPQAFDLEVSPDQGVYCPGDLVVIRVSSSNEISQLDLRVSNPLGKVIPLDISPVPVPDPVPDPGADPEADPVYNPGFEDLGTTQPLYQATCYLDTNAPAGTYILTLDSDSSSGKGADAVSFAVYPLYTYYQDADTDGFGNPNAPLLSCQVREGYVPNQEDCNDSDADINPAAQEICDGLDNNCDGEIDEKFLPSACCKNDECTPHECREDDSGEIDIEEVRGKIGEEIWIPVRIQNAPSQVSTIRFSIAYDPNVFEYLGFERGNLVTSFALFEVNLTVSGRLTARGFTSQDAIPQGASGYLVRLKFKVKDGLKNERSSLLLQGLRDLPVEFSASGACFTYISPEDVNGDGEITLEDARIVLNCFLRCGPCVDYYDINKDGGITPLDALLIFQKCQEITIQPPQN